MMSNSENSISSVPYILSGFLLLLMLDIGFQYPLLRTPPTST
ncbi:MAG: hypothetical protein U5J63_00240 [Fodinibius sp.]|nr:hypothetical protein [Fodinibius sp.]